MPPTFRLPEGPSKEAEDGHRREGGEVRGRSYYVWAAVDLDREEVVEVLVTLGRSGLEALAFLRMVARLCKGRLPRVFVDGGVWYPWALNLVGFRYTVVAFGLRSIIERFLSQLEWRMARFWGQFNRGTRESLRSWV